jgi:RNA polymerase sigma-70 factor (ECF subfamily)
MSTLSHNQSTNGVDALSTLATQAMGALKVATSEGRRPHTQERALVERFFEQLSPRLYRFALKRCGVAEEAQDITQEALIVILRRLPTLEPDTALLAWCFGVVRHRCLKRFSAQQRTLGREGSLEVLLEERGDEVLGVSAEPSPDDVTDDALSWERTQRAIQSLAPLYRETLLLRDIEGLSAEEVSQVVGASVGAVKSRLHRARAELRDVLTSSRPLPPLPTGGCPNVRQMFSEHLEGDLSPTLCKDMEAHVRACVVCAQECDDLKQTLSLCSTSPAGLPPELAERLRGELKRWLDRNHEVE